MSGTVFTIAARMIQNNEGFSTHAYKCSAGKWTIGYGRNIDPDGGPGITQREALQLLHNDLFRVIVELQAGLAFYDRLDEVRQVVLIDMCFNLGIKRLLGFRHMLKAIENGDFHTAADELRNSNYYTQVGGRAVANHRMMKTGKLEE